MIDPSLEDMDDCPWLTTGSEYVASQKNGNCIKIYPFLKSEGKRRITFFFFEGQETRCGCAEMICFIAA